LLDKIAILFLRNLTDSKGGADTVIFNSATLLDSSRFLPIIVYLKNFNNAFFPFSEQFEQRGINYIELPGTKIFDVKQFFNIAKLVKEHNVRIVHCNDPKSDVLGFFLKLLFPKVILVSTLHGWIKRRKRSEFYINIDQFILRWFNMVIAVSRDIEHNAKNKKLKKIFMLHNAIDTTKWRKPQNVSKDPKSPFIIGFIGRISKEKGPFDFISVAAKVLEHDTDCEFMVAGDGPEEGAMKDMVKTLGIHNKVHFLGHLNETMLYDLYQMLDMLLMTSYTEGLPMTVLEACAMSVPVVATNVGGIGEIITHNYNGILSDAGDIDYLAKSVLAIKRNKELAEKIGGNGRIIVEKKFSFETWIKRIEELYTMMIDSESKNKLQCV
jgi:L-malate glycosyltransferase